MELDHRPMERAALGRRLLIMLAVTAVAVVLIVAAAVAFDWTLVAGPSSDLTTDPAGELPF